MKLLGKVSAGVLICTLCLSACGEAGTNTDPSASNNPVTSTSSASVDTGTPATPASATRQDVVEAIRCHLVLSAALVRQSSPQSEEAQRYGASLRYWRNQITVRARAAGLTDDEADALRRETSQSDISLSATAEDQTAEVESCNAQTPPGTQ